MKQIFIFILVIVSLSSCFKQSIADAMLESQNAADNTNKASISYEVNGNLVQESVNNSQQNPQSYKFECSRIAYNSIFSYNFDFLTSTGEFASTFLSDSLKIGKHAFNGPAEIFVLSYYNRNYFVRYTSDTLSFNITSYNKGYISGSFSGRLTELVSQTATTNIYGTPSTCVITNGFFQNVPVFY